MRQHEAVDQQRFVIVNADDFGLAPAVNRGVVEAFERGIVTSASLMVNRPGAEEAARYSREQPAFDIGLHVEVSQWQQRPRPWSLPRSKERVQSRVAREVDGQLDRFRGLVGHDPTHIDSHQHRHRVDLLRPLFETVAQELDVPLRHFHPSIRFCGEFYGHDGRGRPEPEAITPEALIELLERLPAGITELCCHPGYPEGVDMWYRHERGHEVRTLCDPRVRDAIERLGITLASFSEVVGGRH